LSAQHIERINSLSSPAASHVAVRIRSSEHSAVDDLVTTDFEEGTSEHQNDLHVPATGMT
jgi:hypothetical protein